MGKAGSGFKKPANKKTSKKDIIYISLVLAAVVILIAVFAIVVANDDFIRVKNGRLQMDDNWLVAQYAKKNSVEWYQVGEVNDIEGFYLSTESAGSSVKYIYPNDITNNVSVIYVGAGVSDYSEMMDSLILGTAESYTIEPAPEAAAVKLLDKDALVVNCITGAEDAIQPAEETAEEEPTEEIVDEAGEAETSEDAPETEAADEGATTEEVDSEPADPEISEDAPEDSATISTEGQTITLGGDPACIIYACIEYDSERCVFIQVNTLNAVTDEEAQSIIEMVCDSITLVER